MLKFQRNYVMEVGLSDGNTLSIQYPTTLTFATRRDINPSAGSGSFRISNLNQQHRNLIFKDIMDTPIEHARRLSVKAGYGNDLAYIFYGDVSQAGSYRAEQGTEFITQIEGYDGGASRMASFSNWTLTGPVTKQQVINRLVNDIERTGVKVGKISNFSGTYSRGYVAHGYTWELLIAETEGHCNIYNNTAYCLSDDEIVDGPVLRIANDTGLLGSPVKNDTYLKCEIMFDPTVYVGQLAQLESSTLQLFNGEYKVVSVEHNGVISGAVSGKCKTILQLYVQKRLQQLIGI